MRESLGSNMEKYICVFDEITNGLSAIYNFSAKIIFRQLWKACQKLWKVLTIFILCFKLDSTKISHFNNNKCKSTREVAGLLSVLSSQEAQAHLTTLALTEEVEALTLKNAQFDVAFNQKMQEEVERMPQTSINTDELRKQIDAKYSEIVQTVNAYAIVQPSEDINNFINQVNALLTLTKRSMASMGKDSNQEYPTKPETPDTPETPETNA